MAILLTAIFIIVLYYLSWKGAYLFMKKAHLDPKGKWPNVKPMASDVVATFFPGVNTVLALGYVFGFWMKDRQTTYFND